MRVPISLRVHKFQYKEISTVGLEPNAVATTAFTLARFNTVASFIKNGFGKYRIYGVKMEIDPFASQVTSSMSTSGALELYALPSLTVLWEPNLDQTHSVLGVLENPSAKLIPSGRCYRAFRRLKVPYMVSSKQSDGSLQSIDVIGGRKALWISTSDDDFVFGKFYMATKGDAVKGITYKNLYITYKITYYIEARHLIVT